MRRIARYPDYILLVLKTRLIRQYPALWSHIRLAGRYDRWHNAPEEQS